MPKEKHIYLTKNIKPTGPSFVSGQGAFLIDNNGKKYIDFCSQTLNLNFGQCHPKIVQTAIKAARGLTFISSRFVNPIFIKLAENLVKLAPKGLDKINLKLSNGSDANESAIKRARRYSGKDFLISFYGSHIGESSETLCASGYSRYKPYIGGSNKYIMIKPPSPRKAGIDSTYDANWIKNFNKIITARRKNIAGVILEPIMVDAGVIIFPQDYLQKIKIICNTHNIPLIFDEIQTAFGWVGNIFASQYFGVTPDLLTMGKGLSGGYPLAAILMRKKFDVLDYGEDEFTYGGHPLSCATALTTLDILLKTNILKQVQEKSQFFKERLKHIKEKFDVVENYRGIGMIWGLEIKEVADGNNIRTKKIYYSLLKKGLIIRISKGAMGNTLILKPPLVTEKTDIEKAFNIIENVLSRQR